MRRRFADIRLYLVASRASKDRSLSLWVRLKAKLIAEAMRIRVRRGKHRPPQKWLRIKIHGNYCGPGHGVPKGQDLEPIDHLDAACYEHDRAYAEGD